jgi:hypothetical protein
MHIAQPARRIRTDSGGMTSRLSWRAATIVLAVIALFGLSAAAFASTHAGLASGLFASDPHAAHTSPGDHTHAPVALTAPEQQLISSTTTALAAYADVSAAEAAGYRWIGDGTTGGHYRHYVQPSYLLDDDVLDSAHVESLVYQWEADGSQRLVSAMYILPPGDTIADAPAVGTWHVHTNLCWSRDGTIAGTNDSGACPAGSYNSVTPPMLHVWVVDNPLGPFAAIDENGEVSATHEH